MKTRRSVRLLRADNANEAENCEGNIKELENISEKSESPKKRKRKRKSLKEKSNIVEKDNDNDTKPETSNSSHSLDIVEDSSGTDEEEITFLDSPTKNKKTGQKVTNQNNKNSKTNQKKANTKFKEPLSFSNVSVINSNETSTGISKDMDDGNLNDNAVLCSFVDSSSDEHDNNIIAIDSDSDVDDAPTSISKSTSKQEVMEKVQREKETAEAMRQKKRELQVEREQKNKLQKQKNSHSKYSIPEKLDEDVLRSVDNADKEFTVETSEKIEKNQRIVFEEAESIDEGYFEVPKKEITAKCIQNVKVKGKSKDAYQFLQSHFFGNRLNRNQLHCKFSEKRKHIEKLEVDKLRKRKKKRKI